MTKTIGQIDHNRYVLTKRVDSTKHLYRKTNSYGFDKGAIDVLPEYYNIELTETDTGKIYTTPILNLKNQGYVDSFGKHGDQYFLSIEKFK